MTDDTTEVLLLMERYRGAVTEAASEIAQLKAELINLKHSHEELKKVFTEESDRVIEKVADRIWAKYKRKGD